MQDKPNEYPKDKETQRKINIHIHMTYVKEREQELLLNYEG